MTPNWFTPWAMLPVAATCWLAGCTLEKPDDGAEYRDAIPQPAAIAVAGPETDDTAPAPGLSPASLRPPALRPQAIGGSGRADYAPWYAFTRAVRGGVNLVTAQVLGSVWAVAQTEPTTVDEGEATWGPHTDALEPVTYRFRVARIARDEYTYVLEGRPKASHADDTYRALLSGHGYGKSHENHGQGDLTIDLDVARELDPLAHELDSGTVHISYQLPHDWTRGDALPRTIVAEVTPDPALNRESFSVTSNAERDGAGSLDVQAEADVDDSKATRLEAVSVSSRWRADGAGRADISIAGGDVPPEPGVVRAVECWRPDFSRSYYRDSVSFAPTEGEASACVYDAP